MDIPSDLERSSTPTHTNHHEDESFDSPDDAMPPFTPGQCLFCQTSSPSFEDSVKHMQKSHSLFVPSQDHLAVELETLFKYLHLVIFGYRECISCGTQRSTVQAVQQHMTGKGHCKFDISESDSEFAEFYDFSEPEEEDAESGDDEEGNEEASSKRKPQQVDQDSIRLPSGKIISRQSSSQTVPSQTRERRRARNAAVAAQLEHTTEQQQQPDAGSGKEGGGGGSDSDDVPDTQVLSRREKRERAMVSHQLANMSAQDRSSLMHLPTSQQLSVLATQHRHMVKVQKDEKRRQAKVDRKGNKNLYAYWHTETPVYQCG